MKRLRNDMFMYIGLIVICLLFYFVLIPQQIVLRGSWSGDITFTSRTFPYILFAAMGIASLIGVIQTAYKMKRFIAENGSAVKEAGGGLKKLLLPVYFFVLTGVYAFLFDRLGYIIATVVIIPLYLASLKCKKWQYYAITYGVGAVVYLVFKFILNIPL